jgi:hypothetical protein
MGGRGARRKGESVEKRTREENGERAGTSASRARENGVHWIMGKKSGAEKGEWRMEWIGEVSRERERRGEWSGYGE